MNDGKIGEEEQLDAIVHSLKTYLVDPRGQDDFLENLVDQHGRDLVIEGLKKSLGSKNQPNQFADYAKAMISIAYRRSGDYIQHKKFLDDISLSNEVADHDLIELLENNGGNHNFIREASIRIKESDVLAGIIFSAIESSTQSPGDWLVTRVDLLSSRSLLSSLVLQRDGSAGAKKLISKNHAAYEKLPNVDQVFFMKLMIDNIHNPSESFEGAAAPFVLITSAFRLLDKVKGRDLKSDLIDMIVSYVKNIGSDSSDFISHMAFRPKVFDVLKGSFISISAGISSSEMSAPDFYRLAACITAFKNDQFKMEVSTEDTPLKIIFALLNEHDKDVQNAIKYLSPKFEISEEDALNNVKESWQLSMIEDLVDVSNLRLLGGRKLKGIILSDELGI